MLELFLFLSNLETSREKLLRIMLVGQPELQEMLGQKGLRQLSQRITARYHLKPLSRSDVRAYISHRLSVAGGKTSLFTPGAIATVYRVSKGIPRLVNIICDRALLGAYAEDAEKVSARIVRRAAVEALGNTHGTGAVSGGRERHARIALAAIAALLLGGGLLWLSLPKHSEEVLAVTASAPPAVEPEAEETSATAAPVPVAQRLFGAQPTDRLMDRLVALWATSTPPPGVSPCAWLKANVSLHCYEGKDSFDRWRSFNRPSILRLKLDDGSLRHVLVVTADSEGLEVQTSDGTQRLERDWVEQYWTGDYLLLWEPPMGRTLIRSDADQESRLWLTARLEPLGFGSVSAFQASRGLTPDGVAGTRTLLALLAEEPGDAPRLNRASPAVGAN